MEALRTLAGPTTKEDLLDHIEASKVKAFLTAAIASPNCHIELKNIFEEDNLKLLNR